MPNHPIVPDDILANYEVREWRHGLAILAAACAPEWREILVVLREFRLLRSDIVKPGGSKSDISGKIDGHFTRLGWREKKFDTKIVVDNTELAPRLEGGSGGGCPVAVFGIRKEAYVDDQAGA